LYGKFTCRNDSFDTSPVNAVIEKRPPRSASRKTWLRGLVILITPVTIAAILARGGDTFRFRLSQCLCPVRKNPGCPVESRP